MNYMSIHPSNEGPSWQHLRLELRLLFQIYSFLQMHYRHETGSKFVIIENRSSIQYFPIHAGVSESIVLLWYVWFIEGMPSAALLQ